MYDRRCAACHGKFDDRFASTTDWEGRFAWINLTHPELSPALTAHLSKEAGGRGITKSLDSHAPFVFTSPADPEYRVMLEAIRAGSAQAP